MVICLAIIHLLVIRSREAHMAMTVYAYRLVHSSRFLTVATGVVVIVLVCVLTVPFVKVYGSRDRLTTSTYLAQFSWSFPGGQYPSLYAEDLDSLNPGCKKPRSLAAYKPKSPLRYHHQSIVHYAKMFPPDHPTSSEELSYKEYLSMLSYYRFLKPRVILLHSNINAHGKYWRKALKWKDTKVKLNKVSSISTMQGQQVIFWAHSADYVKISAVLEHGGIASDFDVIFLDAKRYREASEMAECIVACEGKEDTCEKINGGFYSCAKNSLYMLNWLKSYHYDYRPWEWVYNAGDIPTQLLTNSSSACYNILVDETISKDPIFEDSKRWLKKDGVNWKNKIVTHYYLRYEADNLPSDENLLKLENSFGDMLRHVVKGDST